MLEFRALDMHDQIVNFTLEDCPVYLSNHKVILAKTEGSTLIKVETITRRDVDTGIAEGDKVFIQDKFAGIIVYNKGFYLQKNSGALEKLELSSHIKIRVGNFFSMREATSSLNRQSITFRYKERTFSMKALLRYSDGFIVIHTSNDYYRKVIPSEIGIATGIDKFCFGDLADGGGRVVLHDLRPCVVIGDKYSELSEIN